MAKKKVARRNAFTPGSALISEERERQIKDEGYSRQHDQSEHKHGQLAWAAVCYAAPERVFVMDSVAHGIHYTDPWPWGVECDKRPHDGNVVSPQTASREERIRLLVKAGALLAAEIGRLQAMFTASH